MILVKEHHDETLIHTINTALATENILPVWYDPIFFTLMDLRKKNLNKFGSCKGFAN